MEIFDILVLRNSGFELNFRNRKFYGRDQDFHVRYFDLLVQDRDLDIQDRHFDLSHLISMFFMLRYRERDSDIVFRDRFYNFDVEH